LRLGFVSVTLKLKMHSENQPRTVTDAHDERGTERSSKNIRGEVLTV
jgi:hypothetical protein